MPTNIASTVTATYDASIPVPLDGEYAHQAALANMVRPVANRAEYLRQRLEGAPWTTLEILEDFCSLIDNSDAGSPHLICDQAWIFSETNTATLAPQSSSAARSALRISTAGGSAVSARLRKQFSQEYSEFERFGCRVAMQSIALADLNVEIGLISATGSNAPLEASGTAISLVGNPTVNPNWCFRTRDGAAETLADSGVTIVAGTHVIAEIVPSGAAYAASINGGSPVLLTANVPSSAAVAGPQIRCAFPNAGASRQIDIDFAYWRWAPVR